MTEAERHIITIYDTTTGAIRCWGMCPIGEENVKEGEAWIEGQYDNTYMRIDITGAEPIAVPLLEFNITVGLNSITGIPSGTLAMVEGTLHPIEDGMIQLEVEDEEDVKVALFNPLYTPWDGEVHCAPD